MNYQLDKNITCNWNKLATWFNLEGEAQELFRGRKEEPLNTKIAKRARFLPILLNENASVFKSSKWQKTTSLKPASQKRIDSIFFNEK